MAPVQKNAKTKKVAIKYVIDASGPAGDKIFDDTAFEKFLHDRIKVNGRTGQLGDNVVISRGADHKITVTANSQLFAKRYLKYLTKKFMKKHNIRDWLRVVATDKNVSI
ncbi:1769_t:CDS:2 [Paraglomus occultum]|uniref:1769_t:CDS:1 n=1 Tax=Paraglomus occultum TaxID=144539 RepID=A0A9N9CWX7_9GLOM|nr:1769_t:CDS:2 [Paraglomus occultum]